MTIIRTTFAIWFVVSLSVSGCRTPGQTGSIHSPIETNSLIGHTGKTKDMRSSIAANETISKKEKAAASEQEAALVTWRQLETQDDEPGATDETNTADEANEISSTIVEVPEQDLDSVAPGSEAAFDSSGISGLSTVSMPADGQSMPIDLPSALQLAGADNWNVQIARERINEASARYQQARSMWLPSLNFGIGYNHHDGQIQETDGNIIDISRNSMFIGGGPVVSQAPLTGGSGGPARLAVDLSFADAIFEPLYRCQLVKAARSSAEAVFNDVQLRAGVAYFELVRAQMANGVAAQDLEEAKQVLNLTGDFVEAGKGASADVSRMQVIVSQREQQQARSKGQVGVTSSNLATILQMDPSKMMPGTVLQSMDATAMPISLFDASYDLTSLVDQALANRPEMRQVQKQVDAIHSQLHAEHMRPLLPNLHLGASGGVFGGGPGDDLNRLDGRADLDVILAWQIENLGVGNRARKRERASQTRGAQMTAAQTRDQISNEVSSAWHLLGASQTQLDLAQANLANAADAMEKTMARIRGLEGDPLELIQSLNAMSAARGDYLNAVVDYNITQLKMSRAIGTLAIQ